MIERFGQALHGIRVPSLAGRGLPERLRSVTFGMAGLVAAVGLGLVAVALNQVLPVVPGSAIPESPKRYLGDAQIVARAPRAAEASHQGGGQPALRHAAAKRSVGHAGEGGREGPRLASSTTHKQPGAVTPAAVGPGSAPPSGNGGPGAPATGAPAGAGAPAAPEPAGAPAPTQVPVSSPVEAPAADTSGSGVGGGQNRGNGHENADQGHENAGQGHEQGWQDQEKGWHGGEATAHVPPGGEGSSAGGDDSPAAW